MASNQFFRFWGGFYGPLTNLKVTLAADTTTQILPGNAEATGVAYTLASPSVFTIVGHLLNVNDIVEIKNSDSDIVDGLYAVNTTPTADTFTIKVIGGAAVNSAAGGTATVIVRKAGRYAHKSIKSLTIQVPAAATQTIHVGTSSIDGTNTMFEVSADDPPLIIDVVEPGAKNWYIRAIGGGDDVLIGQIG